MPILGFTRCLSVPFQNAKKLCLWISAVMITRRLRNENWSHMQPWEWVAEQSVLGLCSFVQQLLKVTAMLKKMDIRLVPRILALAVPLQPPDRNLGAQVASL